MNAPSTRALCACLALFASACTSTSGSSSGTSASGVGDDGGASTTPAAACAYVETIVTGCDGYNSSTPNVRCDDEPCSEETWDPLPTSAGDCYGYDEYSSQTDIQETCDQWQAKGGFSAPSGDDDAGDGGASATCQATASTGSTTCDACVESSCGASWCACSGDANVDDAGLTGCFDYVNCLFTCAGDAGASSLSGCESRCASGYTATERSNGDELASCVFSHCNTSATCG
jgi:hypothetical protein